MDGLEQFQVLDAVVVTPAKASTTLTKVSVQTIALQSIKIAAKVVGQQIATKTLNKTLKDQDIKRMINDGIMEFFGKHADRLTMEDYLMMGAMAENYYKGLNLMAWWRKSDFEKLDRAVIGNENLSIEQKITLTEGSIIEADQETFGVLGESSSIVLFLATEGLFPRVGIGPRGTQPRFFTLPPSKFVLQESVESALGGSYKAIDEVTVPVKNMDILPNLERSAAGEWVKVYEAGIHNGKKVEVHYFRNNQTRQLWDVKIKYDKWHQKKFKSLSLP